MTTYPAPPVAPARRRRLRWRGWVVALVVLVALLVAADRVALAVADAQAAKTFQRSEQLNSTPSVKVRGFPFLTQLAGRNFDRVDATAKDVVLGRNGRTVRVSTVTMQLHHLRVSNNFHSARADTVTAAALITYADLSRTLGVQLGYAGPSSDGRGRIKATQTVSVAGQQVSGTISAEVRISADEVLTFVSPQVSVDGADVPPAVSDQLSAVFGEPIPLERLPFGLRFRSVTAGPAGVTIKLTGTHLSYSGS